MGDEFNKPGAWEDAWQQAFDGAEHTPPNRVWQGLENSLMEQQLRRYKRKLFLYQWLAAASVMLLGVWAGWWMFFAQPQDADRRLAGEGNANQRMYLYLPSAESPSAGLANMGTAAVPSPEAPQSSIAALNQRETQTPDPAQGGGIASQAGSILQEPAGSITESGLAMETPGVNAAGQHNSGRIPQEFISGETQIPDYLLNQLAIEGPIASPDVMDGSVGFDVVVIPGPDRLSSPLVLQDAALEREIRVVGISKKAKKAKRLIPYGDFWVGASLASSLFNPNITQGEGSGLSWSDQPVSGKGGVVYTTNVSRWDDKQNSLPSFDFKVDAGFRISRRWMLQSSVQYGSYQVNTLTGSYTDPRDNKAYPLYYSNFSYSKVQVASPQSRMAKPVDALNSFRFISVPLSLNYVLFENTIGLTLNSGISSEIFLGGKIEERGEATRIQPYTIEAGEDSPFRRVHFNALIGVHLFYRAGPNHMITLEPTYKHALTNFHKDGMVFDSRPSQIGIAAGFRYILR